MADSGGPPAVRHCLTPRLFKRMDCSPITHSADEAVSVPLLMQCRYELFTDWMTAASAPRRKQLVIVISAASTTQQMTISSRQPLAASHFQDYNLLLVPSCVSSTRARTDMYIKKVIQTITQ